MKNLNYSRLAPCEPTVYSTITNQLGQEIVLVEHPSLGDESPVLAMYHHLSVACETDFFDVEDFGPDSDYNPCYIHGKWVSAYELSDEDILDYHVLDPMIGPDEACKGLTVAILSCMRGESDGFTLDRNLDGPTGGYMVGTGQKERSFPHGYEVGVYDYAKDIVASFGNYAIPMYLGGWNHEGKTVVEMSVRIDNLKHALKVARETNQISIWDVANGEEIVIEY